MDDKKFIKYCNGWDTRCVPHFMFYSLCKEGKYEESNDQSFVCYCLQKKKVVRWGIKKDLVYYMKEVLKKDNEE